MYIIDESESICEDSFAAIVATVQESAIALLTRHQRLRVSVALYGTSLRGVSAFTSSEESLVRALNSVVPQGGVADTPAAILASVDLFQSSSSAASKILIVATDGDLDGTSNEELDNAVQESANEAIRLMVVGSTDANSASILRRIAKDSAMIFPSGPEGPSRLLSGALSTAIEVETADPCDAGILDVLFLLDASSNIQASEFSTMQSSILQTAGVLLASQSDVRVAAADLSDRMFLRAEWSSQFIDFSSGVSFSGPQSGGQNLLATSLQEAVQYVRDSARPQSTKIVILLSGELMASSEIQLFHEVADNLVRLNIIPIVYSIQRGAPGGQVEFDRQLLARYRPALSSAVFANQLSSVSNLVVATIENVCDVASFPDNEAGGSTDTGPGRICSGGIFEGTQTACSCSANCERCLEFAESVCLVCNNLQFLHLGQCVDRSECPSSTWAYGSHPVGSQCRPVPLCSGLFDSCESRKFCCDIPY